MDSFVSTLDVKMLFLPYKGKKLLKRECNEEKLLHGYIRNQLTNVAFQMILENAVIYLFSKVFPLLTER